jgi:uncharacterized protein YraI
MIRALTLAGALVLGLTLPTLVDAATATGLVNIRSGPGTKHPVILIAMPGLPVTVHSCSKNWCKVTYGATNGWMSAHHISK